jgi:hypothetical protein
MNQLTKEYRKTDTHFFFWNTIYSQWFTSKNQIIENGIKFQNAEQYMMYHKAILFNDKNIANLILRLKSPRKIKELGRQISNFNEEIWNENKEQIVSKGNYLKFSQNEDLKENLLSKDMIDLILVEASPYDKIWGIGLHFEDDDVLDEKKWKGENLLGKCIMNARKIILSKIK